MEKQMRSLLRAVALTAVLSTVAVTGLVWAQSPTPPAAVAPTAAKNVNDWLLNAPDDIARFKLLQTYLRGFDQPMWEVGERYQSTYDALADKNYELAEYHWDKIKATIVNGYLKRPKRQDNADAMFVKNIWDDVNKAFLSKDATKAGMHSR